jgi:A/G-specific adenine glycosylase
VQDLAAAEDAEVMAEWAGLGYYARARNLLKCARVVASELGGRFSGHGGGAARASRDRALYGGGHRLHRLRPARAVLDGNIERVMSRLFAVTEPLPGSKPELKALAARLTPKERPGCHAQALMDLGATICTPKSPACGICPLMPGCAGRQEGIAADLPAKAPKKGQAGAPRHRLPCPTQGWCVPPRDATALRPSGRDAGLARERTGRNAIRHRPSCQPTWHDPGLEVRHTFTHFHLRLSLRMAVVDADAHPERAANSSPSTNSAPVTFPR